MSADGETIDIHPPRLCHIKKFTLEQGYGFSIKKSANDLYPIIDNVGNDSPADRAGVKTGDMLIEVNYYDICTESYKDVMKIIRYGLEIDEKVIEHEVILLVVDKKTYDYYVNQNIRLRSTNDNVLKVEILSN